MTLDRRTMVLMRRGSKLTISSAESKRPLANRSKPSSAQIARIRERREQIYKREGVLSDSALLIREDRDR